MFKNGERAAKWGRPAAKKGQVAGLFVRFVRQPDTSKLYFGLFTYSFNFIMYVHLFKKALLAQGVNIALIAAFPVILVYLPL